MALRYFSKLPIIEYPISKDTNKKARDILHRLFFDQKVLEQSEYIRKYQVKGGDRLEIISNKLYGRPDVYSIIMLLNNFDTTMLSGLPPMSSVYDEYLQEKYSDTVYSVIPIGFNLLASGNGYSGGYVFPLLQHGFRVGEKIFGVVGSGNQNFDTKAYVKEWNPVLSTLKLDILQGSFYEGLTISNEDGSINFKINMKKNGKDALHHFEAITTTTGGTTPLLKGAVIDPLSRFNITGTGSIRITPIGINPGTDQFGNIGATGSYGSSLIYQYNFAKDLPSSYKTYIKVVTNSEYEERLQEKKRWISVPATEPVLLGEVIAAVNRLLESTTKE